MLIHEQNETLVRVGPETPLGGLSRLYWIPFYPADGLPYEGQPKRIKSFTENLVAFCDGDGRSKLITNTCPRCGATLMFGRNEECGLCCVYFGWKCDVEERVVDMPTKPVESGMKDSMRGKTYPICERIGVF